MNGIHRTDLAMEAYHRACYTLDGANAVHNAICTDYPDITSDICDSQNPGCIAYRKVLDAQATARDAYDALRLH